MTCRVQSWGNENLERHWGFVECQDLVVMDVGADWGSTSFYFLNRGAGSVIAVECDPVYLVRLKRLAKELTNLTVVPMRVSSTKDFRSLIEEHEPDVMKIDCEGCETFLLDLEDRVFSTVRFYALELHPARYYQESGNPFLHGLDEMRELLLEKFERCGFSVVVNRKISQCWLLYAEKKSSDHSQR